MPVRNCLKLQSLPDIDQLRYWASRQRSLEPAIRGKSRRGKARFTSTVTPDVHDEIDLLVLCRRTCHIPAHSLLRTALEPCLDLYEDQNERNEL